MQVQCLLLLAGSAYAADAQVKIVVAAAEVKNVRVQPAALLKVDAGISRFSDYRVDGIFLAP